MELSQKTKDWFKEEYGYTLKKARGFCSCLGEAMSVGSCKSHYDPNRPLLKGKTVGELDSLIERKADEIATPVHVPYRRQC